MSTRVRTGLVIFGLLSVADLASIAVTDGSHPPYLVAALDAVLGAVSLYYVVSAWRGNAAAARPLLALRILSALSATPAFFVHDVPAAALAAAVTIIALTAVGCVLVAQPSVVAAVAR